MLRQLYRLDKLAYESRSDVAELGCSNLSEPFLKHQLHDPLQLEATELVLPDPPIPPLLFIELEGELITGNLELLTLLLAAPLKLRDRAREIQRFCNIVVDVGLLQSSRLGSEACSELGCKLAVFEQLFLAQPRRLHAERLGFLLEAIGVEHELAPFHLGLLADHLEVLVEGEVFGAVVDHKLLLFHQLQRLDSRPLERLDGPTTLHFLLLLFARRRALLGLDDPVDR